jgi:hypothetical protein
MVLFSEIVQPVLFCLPLSVFLSIQVIKKCLVLRSLENLGNKRLITQQRVGHYEYTFFCWSFHLFVANIL